MYFQIKLQNRVAESRYGDTDMIPKALLYRIYGDSLAVIMNVKLNRVILLEDEALRLWKKLLGGSTPSAADIQHPAYAHLLSYGVLEAPQNQTRPEDSSFFCPPEQSPALDLAVLNLWAFKNHIPIAGHFELTGRCNLRCNHCYCLFEHKTDALSTVRILQILDELRDSGTFGLVLTGGEIFFRKDIMDILAHLNQNRFVVRINTNGTLINEAVVEALAGFSNIYRIHISLYGPDADTHDGITNSRGSFAKTLSALHLLKEAGLKLRINCSLMKSNFEGYQRIKSDIADKLDIPIHYDSVIFPKDDGSTDNLAEELEQVQVAQFLDFKSKISENSSHQRSTVKKPKLCKAGFSFFSICEDGQVYPCLKMKRVYSNPLGNLNTDSFKDLWENSVPIQNIRVALAAKLRNCNVCDLTI